ncbi:MAG TPA: hypothetical protein VIP77_12445 [Jiangellaceae bacterium]
MRTIKARALTEDHFGQIVSCAQQPEPRALAGLTRGLTFTTLYWAPPASGTTVEPDDEVTIHDGGGGG